MSQLFLSVRSISRSTRQGGSHCHSWEASLSRTSNAGNNFSHEQVSPLGFSTRTAALPLSQRRSSLPHNLSTVAVLMHCCGGIYQPSQKMLPEELQ